MIFIPTIRFYFLKNLHFMKNNSLQLFFCYYECLDIFFKHQLGRHFIFMRIDFFFNFIKYFRVYFSIWQIFPPSYLILLNIFYLFT
jgi:hypothetical protein